MPLGLFAIVMGPSNRALRPPARRRHLRWVGATARLAFAQGAYFAAAGLWPLVDMRSFERVTGRKREKWLVETVGAVVLAIGGTLLLAARRGDESPSVRTLGMMSAAALAAIELRYGLSGEISPVYLADSILELGLVAGWAWAPRRERNQSARASNRRHLRRPRRIETRRPAAPDGSSLAP